MTQREARLKPEHAHLYPGIEPGRWEGARILSDKVLACRLLQPSGGFVLNERALHPEHFEFRYGGLPEAETELRRRSADRMRSEGD